MNEAKDTITGEHVCPDVVPCAACVIAGEANPSQPDRAGLERQGQGQPPKRVFLKACHPANPNHNCSWTVSKDSKDSVEYVLADTRASSDAPHDPESEVIKLHAWDCNCGNCPEVPESVSAPPVVDSREYRRGIEDAAKVADEWARQLRNAKCFQIAAEVEGHAISIRALAATPEPSCWHCGDVLADVPKLRCERCPDECDTEDCDAMGCAAATSVDEGEHPLAIFDAGFSQDQGSMHRASVSLLSERQES